MSNADPATPAASPEGDDGLASYVREAWGNALVAVGDAGDEVQKILSRIGGWVEMRPEEARRVAAELSERLRQERLQIEEALDGAVRRSVAPFRLPTREQLSDIEARLEAIEGRLDRLAAKRRGR
jgi:polyhydroxyalkanoate synthesis regulator phasin